MKENKNRNFIDFLKLFFVGILAGCINGFFGAGGGLLLVPMISYVEKCEQKISHATTLSCVLFMCLASSIIYFVKNEFDYKYILICSIGSLFGSYIGTKLLRNLKNNVINFLFSFVLILAGIFMIVF